MNGLEILPRMIGSGTHSKVFLGSYFKTPVAVKEYLDQESFLRERMFYEKARLVGSHPNLLSVMGYVQSE
jgi:hypothetical protein